MGPGGNLPEYLNTYVSNGLGGRVRLITNSVGFRNDREFHAYPPSGVLRILSLGDSFTAGYRVGQKETFSFLLEDWINHHYGKCEVLVAETEEPATSLYYLDRFGVKFHPDVVLLGITLGNDLAQTYLSLDQEGGYKLLDEAPGGVRIERHPGTQKSYRSFTYGHRIPPEYLRPQSPLQYVLSEVGRWVRTRRIFRRLYQDEEPITCWCRNPISLFDANNGLGMFTSPPPPEIAEAFHKLERVLGAFQIYCERCGIILAVAIFPQRFQVSPADWHQAVAEYSLKATHFDLMGPNQKIRAYCRKHNIFLIDPTTAMAAYYARTGINLYLPRGDMHWNQEGHRAFLESSQEAFATLAARGVAAVRVRDSRCPLLAVKARQ